MSLFENVNNQWAKRQKHKRSTKKKPRENVPYQWFGDGYTSWASQCQIQGHSCTDPAPADWDQHRPPCFLLVGGLGQGSSGGPIGWGTPALQCQSLANQHGGIWLEGSRRRDRNRLESEHTTERQEPRWWSQWAWRLRHDMILAKVTESCLLFILLSH